MERMRRRQGTSTPPDSEDKSFQERGRERTRGRARGRGVSREGWSVKAAAGARRGRSRTPRPNWGAAEDGTGRGKGKKQSGVQDVGPSGFIFGCTTETEGECLKRSLFGLPPNNLEMVKKIGPGTPLFLFNYDSRELSGIFAAASQGGEKIVAEAWGGDFPAQVRVVQPKNVQKVLEATFKPVLRNNYFVGHKFVYSLKEDQVAGLCRHFDQQVPKVGHAKPPRNPLPYTQAAIMEPTTIKPKPGAGLFGGIRGVTITPDSVHVLQHAQSGSIGSAMEISDTPGPATVPRMNAQFNAPSDPTDQRSNHFQFKGISTFGGEGEVTPVRRPLTSYEDVVDPPSDRGMHGHRISASASPMGRNIFGEGLVIQGDLVEDSRLRTPVRLGGGQATAEDYLSGGLDAGPSTKANSAQGRVSLAGSQAQTFVSGSPGFEQATSGSSPRRKQGGFDWGRLSYGGTSDDGSNVKGGNSEERFSDKSNDKQAALDDGVFNASGSHAKSPQLGLKVKQSMESEDDGLGFGKAQVHVQASFNQHDKSQTGPLLSQDDVQNTLPLRQKPNDKEDLKPKGLMQQQDGMNQSVALGNGGLGMDDMGGPSATNDGFIARQSAGFQVVATRNPEPAGIRKEIKNPQTYNATGETRIENHGSMEQQPTQMTGKKRKVFGTFEIEEEDYDFFGDLPIVTAKMIKKRGPGNHCSMWSKRGVGGHAITPFSTTPLREDVPLKRMKFGREQEKLTEKAQHFFDVARGVYFKCHTEDGRYMSALHTTLAYYWRVSPAKAWTFLKEARKKAAARNQLHLFDQVMEESGYIREHGILPVTLGKVPLF